MTAEIGLFSLILALFFACLLTIVPTVGLLNKKQAWIEAGSAYVIGQFVFISIAFICLALSFLQNDFSLPYVASNSSLSLPWFYKICALWGGHEGSMLLWVAILSLWMVTVVLFSRHLDSAFRCRVLVVLGALSIGFILFLLLTSNPFIQVYPAITTTGRDLNPLLQDPGFLFHPPMLYMGYVGFAIAFAFAIATLWMGEMQAVWAKWARPWTLAAWCCLTAGITLGSWWAYRELGWGGWWFWDPVENASFMPWLVGTALIHSLMVSEKRQQFIGWTLLLAITAFSLSLIGTFLVRSGVLTSVHAFAVDPERGIYILSFLIIVIGGSLLLFSFRAQNIKKDTVAFWFSREFALLLNNVFLVVMMLTVLMGTLYPLLIDGLGLGKLSVGAPYFNAVFVPLMVPFLILMGLGVSLKWQQDSLKQRLKGLLPWMIASLVISWLLLYGFTGTVKMYAYLGLSLASWILLSCFRLIVIQLKKQGIKGLSQSFLAMCFAHGGMAVTVIGISLSTSYGIQDDIIMSAGIRASLGSFVIQFIDDAPLKGPNYQGRRAHFLVKKGNQSHDVYPEKRLYEVGQMPMTDAAIDVTAFRDIYIALGEPLDSGAWSVRLYYKPFVRWIWAGGFMIAFGGFLGLARRRYFKRGQT